MRTKENDSVASIHQEKAKKLKKLRRWQIVVSILGIVIIAWGIIQVVCLFLNIRKYIKGIHYWYLTTVNTKYG